MMQEPMNLPAPVFSKDLSPERFRRRQDSSSRLQGIRVFQKANGRTPPDKPDTVCLLQVPRRQSELDPRDRANSPQQYANLPLRLLAKLTWFVIGPVSSVHF